MKKIQIFIIILLSTSLSLWSKPKELYFKNVPIDNDLSQPSAISLCQDQLGNIWYGNDILNKYDGTSTTKYRLSDYINGLNGSSVKQICSNSKHNIYILVNDLLIIYNGYCDKFTDTQIKANYIFVLDDIVYFAYKNSIYTYDVTSKKQTQLLSLEDVTIQIRSFIYSADKNVLWIGTNKGVYVKNDDLEPVQTLADVNVNCLFIDSKKSLWVGTVNSGVHIINYTAKTSVKFDTNTPLLDAHARLYDNNIRCFAEDDEQNIWIGTYNGITLYDPKSNSSVHIKHQKEMIYSLPHNSVYSIYKDKQGTMWVATYYGGVSYFNPSMESYTYYGANSSQNDLLSGMIIGNIDEDSIGNLYIATEEGGVNVLNRNTGNIQKYDTNNKALPHNTIKSIYYDEKYGKLYAGTFTEGLLMKSDKESYFKQIGTSFLESSNQKIIADISAFDDDFILILTQESIYKVNRKTQEISPYFADVELQPEQLGIIHSMYIDNDKSLWVSTTNKGVIYIASNGVIKYFKISEWGLNQEYLRVAKIRGKDNKIYFLLETQILSYDKKTHTHEIIKEKGRKHLNNRYFNIAFLKNGNIIATSKRGIMLIDKDSHASTLFYASKASPLQAVNASCGLYISKNDDQIFIGGIGGLLSLSEKDIRNMYKSASVTDNAQLYFSSLTVNNEKIDVQSVHKILREDIAYTNKVILKYTQNNISLTYATPNLIHTPNIEYEYILRGYDTQWTLSNDKVIRYTSLPPGKYMLEVRNRGNKEQSLTLEIVITPPFYMTRWAYILYGLFALLIVYFALWFTKRNAWLKASLQMKEREQTHIKNMNQTKIDFITNISHEFRTPLTLICSTIELIFNRYGNELSSGIKDRVKNINKHTREMQMLIDELVHFTKYDNPNFDLHHQYLEIVSFTNDVYLTFKEYAQTKNIKYSLSHAGENINLWFDPIQLKKVLYNLLSNAFKFTKDHDSITITIVKKKKYVEISVADTGRGINEDDQKYIFDRFFQVEHDKHNEQWSQGMGIGLFLSKSIIDKHNGNIKVQSKLNTSSIFTIELPLAKPTEEVEGNNTKYVISDDIIPNPEKLKQQAFEKKSMSSEHENRYTILIIEDNTDLLDLLNDAFSPIYDVIMATNGEMGLSFAIEHQPNIILSDVMLPNLSGLELCRKVKQHALTSHIPIILLTARASIDQMKEGLKLGADDYITKPFDLSILILKCNNLIRYRKKHEAIDRSSNSTTTSSINVANQTFINEVEDVLNKYLSNAQFDTNIWAKEMKIGRSKLFERIKDITGTTPNEYLIEFRLQKATLLLIHKQGLSISEIAYQVGFTSPSYFSKKFKDLYGLSPLDYRNK